MHEDDDTYYFTQNELTTNKTQRSHSVANYEIPFFFRELEFITMFKRDGQ
jgi:hypothetical protein